MGGSIAPFISCRRSSSHNRTSSSDPPRSEVGTWPSDPKQGVLAGGRYEIQGRCIRDILARSDCECRGNCSAVKSLLDRISAKIHPVEGVSDYSEAGIRHCV